MNEFQAYSGKSAYKVSEITRIIKEALETIVDIWVEGEISNIRIPSSGHIYFTLKDDQSQIRCVIFKHATSNLKFSPKDGMKVLLHGKIGVYEKNGEYQVIGDRMLPAGIGELQLAFERLKRKLQEEGLFDKTHKKPLPLLPRRIGVVTSPTGAAIRDIINIITRRFENANIVVYPVMVQGVSAAEEIANGIYQLNKMNNVDVIIVGRGGGSIEDLWAFNEEVVARSIYSSKIPIISAVGHEIDYTIADYVADLRAPTPSAAAELVVPEKSNVKREISSLNLRLLTNIKSRIETAKRELQSVSKSLSVSRMQDSINQYRQGIDGLLDRSYNNIKSYLHDRQLELKLKIERTIHLGPADQIEQLKQKVENIRSRFILDLKHILESERQIWMTASNRLNALSPLAVLERGYSICLARSAKRIIKNAGQVDVGDEVDLKLAQGELACKVTNKTK